MKDDDQRTVFSMAGTAAGAMLSTLTQDIAGAQVRLTDLEMSTGGGHRARQSITLAVGEDKRPVVIGWLDMAAKQGSVLSFKDAQAAFARRHEDIWEADSALYVEVREAVEALFQIQKVAYDPPEVPESTPDELDAVEVVGARRRKDHTSAPPPRGPERKGSGPLPRLSSRPPAKIGGEHGKAPAWLMLVAGVLVGLVVAFLITQ